MDENMKTALAFLIGENNADLTFKISEIAGFELSSEQREPFLSFHKFITDPVPEFISTWRVDTETEQKYYVRVVGGVLDHVQNAYLAVWYHRGRLTEIEGGLRSLFSNYDFELIAPGSSMVLGNTVKWAMEYQAFVLAYRRTLDYLTYALNGYFKQQGHSYNDWRRQLAALRDRKQNLVAAALLEAYDKYRPEFNFVVTENGDMSVRDRIAHNQFVGVPAINMTRRGLVYAGGGEYFDPAKGHDKLLSDVLQARLDTLKAYLSDLLSAFAKKAK